MGIFKKKTQTASSGKREIRKGAGAYASVIVRPRITEKASYLTADGAYTFVVAPDANKVLVKRAVEETYGVSPVRVAIINNAARREVARGRTVVRSGLKKAVVYLKKGDTIEFV